MFGRKKKSAPAATETKAPNLSFLYEIEPKGNMIFDERLIKKGDGFETCLHVYEYPTVVYDFWLQDIINRPNVVVTIDIASAPMDQVRQDINSSLSEDLNRIYSDTEDVAKLDAQFSYQNLQELYNRIKQAGEVIKLVHTRIYVSARTPEDLYRAVKELQEELDGMNYRNSVYLNETEYEWRALFTPYSKQMKCINRREGNPIPASALAAGYPFVSSSLLDPAGKYLGDTMTGGTVLFDQFHKTLLRLSYDILAVGSKGAGKSTLLKKLVKLNAIDGNFIRIIDVTGDFTELVEKLGGKVIGLDGSEGILNYLEVYKTDENEHTSFAKHLSKMNMLYRFLSPDSTTEERNDFENIVRQLYVEMGLWGGDLPMITGLPAQAYPTFSDLLLLIRSQLYENIQKRTIQKNLTENRIRRLENMELVISNLVQNYGQLFDGHSTVQDITGIPVVSFNIRPLTSVKSEIFNAMMFNILNLFWDNLFVIGMEEKQKFDAGETDLAALTKFCVVIDEAHAIVNTNNELVLDFVLDFLREMRKYFGSLTLASQYISDFFPKGGSGPAEDKMRTVFALAQYKFIMQQGSSALEMLRSVFEGELTDSELQRIPGYIQGQCLLMSNGSRPLEMIVRVTDEELALFKGGA